MLAGAMAESPHFMIASGWRQDENGNFVQDQTYDPGVVALRNNLVGIGAVGAAPIVATAAPVLLPTAGEIAADWAITKPILTNAGKEIAFGMGVGSTANAFHVARTGKTWE
jgi:hypothetical protein